VTAAAAQDPRLTNFARAFNTAKTKAAAAKRKRRGAAGGEADDEGGIYIPSRSKGKGKGKK